MFRFSMFWERIMVIIEAFKADAFMINEEALARGADREADAGPPHATGCARREPRWVRTREAVQNRNCSSR